MGRVHGEAWVSVRNLQNSMYEAVQNLEGGGELSHPLSCSRDEHILFAKNINSLVLREAKHCFFRYICQNTQVYFREKICENA